MKEVERAGDRCLISLDIVLQLRHTYLASGRKRAVRSARIILGRRGLPSPSGFNFSACVVLIGHGPSLSACYSSETGKTQSQVRGLVFPAAAPYSLSFSPVSSFLLTYAGCWFPRLASTRLPARIARQALERRENRCPARAKTQIDTVKNGEHAKQRPAIRVPSLKLAVPRRRNITR